ncbi:MAG: DUF5371 family protein [Archaeoglobaceae archaeon]
MEKIIIVQTKLPKDILEDLKNKTGESTTKEALSTAINHYINCFMAEKEQKRTRKAKKRRSGRIPVYLNQLFEKYDIDKESITNDIDR